jgi:hypothetical protein
MTGSQSEEPPTAILLVVNKFRARFVRVLLE